MNLTTLRPLGSSGLLVSPLALGTMTFGTPRWGMDEAASKAVFDRYVELGGKVSRVKTYGELITAIINPSHKLARGYAEEVVADHGESHMYIYNSHMTVQELIDIVMYLQPKYDVKVPAYHYRVYPIT